MAPIYNEITFNWEGQEVKVRPTFRMVQKIEGRGISIFGVYQSIVNGEPRVTQVAEIIASLLQSGGQTVSVEKVYQRLMHEPDTAWEGIANAILAVFMPVEPRSKNSEGPEDGASGIVS